MLIWTLARLEFFLEKSQFFFEGAVSVDTEMGHLDVLCTGHLPASWRPETWLGGGWYPILGRLASALIAENLSK